MQNQPAQAQGAPRKLRKIKRPKTATQASPVSYGTPAKVNYQQAPASQPAETATQNNYTQNQVSNYSPNETSTNYYSSNNGAENIKIAEDDELISRAPETIADVMKNKTVVMLMVIAAMIGAVLSYMFVSATGNSSGHGLDGIVFNSDVPAGRSRCGLVEKHQGCVLYIMNPKNFEVSAKDFYATAAKWTERERYLIETGNMHYGSTRIRPGYIAQINIPPLSY